MEAFKTAAVQLLVFSSAFVLCKTQTAVITPLSYTARLGNVGIFHCAVTGSNIISWYINGLPSGYPSVRRRGIYTSRATSINTTWIQSNLTIPATWENNGVSVDCAALLDGPQTTGISELATFHVQGPPLPPANLTLEVSQEQRYLILKWNPPSPSNASTITMYTVYANMSHTGTVTHYNTSIRNYTIRNPCSDVRFKVTSWDDIGEGSTATSLAYRYNSTADTELSIPSTVRVSISFAVPGEPKVELSFQVQSNSFHERLQVCPQSFLVETWSDCSGSRHHQGPLMLELTIVNSTATLVIPHLPPKCHITATIRNQSSSSNTSFDTHGVQDVEMSEGSVLDSICVTCIFAQGTSVQGCYIILLENHDSVVTNTTGLRIEREGDSLNVTGCIENLEEGTYHVVVYDIEEDGTVYWHNSALFLNAALNWTASDQLNTNEEEMLIPNSNITLQKDTITSAIAGGAVGGALLIVVTIVILSCVLILRKVHSTTQNSKQNSHDNTDDIEMKKNEIYGQLPQQQVVRNPAYNWWKLRSS